MEMLVTFIPLLINVLWIGCVVAVFFYIFKKEKKSEEHSREIKLLRQQISDLQAEVTEIKRLISEKK